MKNKRLRNALITFFVILWTLVFHYESTRFFYLNPLFKQKLPKIKLLFPPAGWIMFYSVGNQGGNFEVYGVKDGKPQLIDPHDIFRTRTIGFDNIHRGILGSAARVEMARPFCRYLKHRLPYFDKFIVNYVYYPNITEEHYKRIERVQYQCVD